MSCREVNRAWGNGDFLKPDGKFDNNEWVRRFFGSSQKIHKNLEAKDLLSALTDEYRVAMAKEALLGSSSGANSGVRFYRGAVDDIHHSPAVATPDEFLKYFQEQRTTLAVSMLPDLGRELRRQGRRPNRASRTCATSTPATRTTNRRRARRQPGFKEPRRIKVEYFSYRPDSSFAKKLAARATELLPLFRLGDARRHRSRRRRHRSWPASVAALADLDTALRTLYEEYRKEETDRVLKYDKSDDSPFAANSVRGST